MESFLNAPLVEPFSRLLRSRRFTTAVIAVVVSAVVSLFPGLEEIRTELFIAVNTGALALITGYSWEDASTASRQDSDLAESNLREAIRDAVFTAIDDVEFVMEDEEIVQVEGPTSSA